MSNKFRSGVRWKPNSYARPTRTGTISAARVKAQSGGVIVTHREYIKDIAGTVPFTVEAFGVNPGDPGSFPWLSNMASQFENYRWLNCRFEFISTSGESLAGANTSLGTVVMATQYNSLNPPFVAKDTMENYDGAVATKPSVSCAHTVQHWNNPFTVLYVRPFNKLPDGFGNLLQYDVGQFYLATSGQAAGVTTIGELWVSYSVMLFKPRLNPFFNNTNPYYSLFNLAPRSIGAAAVVATPFLYATAVADYLGVSFDLVTGLTCHLPVEALVGDRIQFDMIAIDYAVGAPVPPNQNLAYTITLTNCAALYLVTMPNTAASATSTNSGARYIIQKTGPGPWSFTLAQTIAVWPTSLGFRQVSALVQYSNQLVPFANNRYDFTGFD